MVLTSYICILECFAIKQSSRQESQSLMLEASQACISPKEKHIHIASILPYLTSKEIFTNLRPKSTLHVMIPKLEFLCLLWWLPLQHHQHLCLTNYLWTICRFWAPSRYARCSPPVGTTEMGQGHVAPIKGEGSHKKTPTWSNIFKYDTFTCTQMGLYPCNSIHITHLCTPPYMITSLYNSHMYQAIIHSKPQPHFPNHARRRCPKPCWRTLA